jgi:2-polyprenyl-3-methyl-5-hydroxy-6-metoxy-1,4-benzoquinol methylase
MRKYYNSCVKKAVLDRLLSINRQFYQQFAAEFDATRQRVQPGVARMAAEIEPQARVLDLGCGNGSLRRALVGSGHRGPYTGLDFSRELLALAAAGAENDPQTAFFQADLSRDDWDRQLAGLYDVVCAFAALHHLPPAVLTRTLLKVRRLLAGRSAESQGRLVFSTWQFLNSPRLQERIVPWERLALAPEDLDAGDYLLDWRRGGQGHRYVHLYRQDELEKLALRTGFALKDSFYSDGKEGNLALYQTWQPVLAAAELVTLADLDRGQASALLSLLLDCFPGGEWPAENPVDQFLAREADRLAAGVRARRSLVWRGSEPVAHAAIFGRQVKTRQAVLQVGAISAVCVAAGERRAGLGTRVVRRLFDLVDQGEYPVALWQTKQVGFYEKLGARPVQNEWVNSQNNENPDADPWPNEVKMIYPPDYGWPEGPIDLNGQPF